MTRENNIVNPNEHLEIPEWINEDYFIKVLEKDEPNYVKVLKFTPVAAIPPGENFTSVMLRIYIDLEMNDGSLKAKTYIFKTMLAEEKGGKLIDEFGLFPKEMNIYKKYLPAFEELYKAAGKEVQIAPKCLHTEIREGKIHFIFEDLSVKKFINVDRIKGLDMPHMRKSLQKIAEFHAASAVYADINGLYPTEFDHGFVTKSCEDFHVQNLQLKGKEFQKSMDSWNMEDTEKYKKNFPTAEQSSKLFASALEQCPDDFHVLNHGDFWSSNIMYNYLANGSLDEILLLDFQLCNWGSPAQDLLFFITLSAANDIRIKEFDRFIEIYYDNLIECLKILDYKKPLPKLRDLHSAMYKQNNTFYAFFAVFNHLAVIQYPSDKDCNLHVLDRKDEVGQQFRLRLYSNPSYAEILREIYPFYCRRGIFKFSDFD